MKLLTVKGNEMKKLLLALLTIGVCGTAVAHERERSGDGYIGIDGGVTHNTNASSEKAFRLYFGKKVDDLVSTELGYFRTGHIKIDDSNENHKMEGLELVAKIHPIDSGFYLKAGGHLSQMTAIKEIGSKRSPETTTTRDNGLGYLYGVGYEHDFSNHMAGDVSATRYERLGGEAGQRTNIYSLGIKYKF